jgi:hypothetical protein
MNFEYSQKSVDLQKKLSDFIEKHIIPVEDEFYAFQKNPENSWTRWPKIELLKQKAKEAGLWNLFLPKDYGDLSPGLTNLEYAPLAGIMGKRIWISEIFNCSAPDTGNMEVLAKYGSDSQKNEWLTPLEIRSLWRLTARKDQYTTNDSNGNSGYGKVDAFETLKIIDQYANIPKQQLNQGWVYFVNGDQQLVVSNIKNPDNYKVFIYNCNGQLIENRRLTMELHFIDIDDLSSGVYFIKIEDLWGNNQLSGKFIK